MRESLRGPPLHTRERIHVAGGGAGELRGTTWGTDTSPLCKIQNRVLGWGESSGPLIPKVAKRPSSGLHSSWSQWRKIQKTHLATNVIPNTRTLTKGASSWLSRNFIYFSLYCSLMYNVWYRIKHYDSFNRLISSLAHHQKESVNIHLGQ